MIGLLVIEMSIVIEIGENEPGVAGTAFIGDQCGGFGGVRFIEVTERFIHHQPLKRLHERTYDGDALFLAIGKRSAALLQHVAYAEAFRHFPDLFLRIEWLRMHHAFQFNVLPGGELIEQAKVLEHNADLLLADGRQFILRVGRPQLSVDLYGAGIIVPDIVQIVYQRGFAGAGGRLYLDELRWRETDVAVPDVRLLLQYFIAQRNGHYRRKLYLHVPVFDGRINIKFSGCFTR